MKILISFLTLVLSFQAYTQFKVTNADGKVITKQISEGEKAIKLTLPVPSESGNHELIQYVIALQSKSDNKAENRALWDLASFQFYKDYKADFLKGKSTVELWAFKADKTSDFTYTSYPNVTHYFDPTILPSISKRTEQYYDLVIEIYGKDVSGYEHRDDGYGNIISDPQYKFEKLGTYKIGFDGGKPAESIAATFGTFSVPKLDLNVVELVIGKMDLSDMKKRYPYNLHPKDAITIKSISGEKNYFYFKGMSFPKSITSYVELKDIVLENLVRDANSYYNYTSVFHGDDLVFIEELSASYVESKEGETSSGFKGKLDKFKNDWANAGGITEDKIQEKIAYAKENLEWKTAQFGGVSCEQLELMAYTKKELKSNSDNKVYELDPEKKLNKRPINILIAEKGDHVFLFCFFKIGEAFELTSSEQELKNKLITGVILL